MTQLAKRIKQGAIYNIWRLKGEPIIKGIDHISAHPLAKEHILLIDDARCFTGEDDYPPEAELKKYLEQKGFGYFTKIHDTYLTAAKPVKI